MIDYDRVYYEQGHKDGYSQAYKEIERNSDYVKVIRCKGCKYYKKSFCDNRRDYCDKHSTLEYTEYVNPTDYCSKGERKETE